MEEKIKTMPFKFPFFSNMYYFLILTAKWIVTGRKDLRYYAMERLGNMFNPHFHFTEFGEIWREDKKFEKWYAATIGDNFHSIDRKYTVKQFLQLLTNVPGDTVECGAYKGATSYLICDYIHQQGQPRLHHIFDSFEGLSNPKNEDGLYWKQGDMAANETCCRNNLAAFDFVKYYKGWIPDRFDEVKDGQFSFIHIDVDLYQPTLDALTFFYDRLNKRGVLICDDYGFSTCPGTTKAMDDFFKNKPEKVIMLTTGQSFIIKE